MRFIIYMPPAHGKSTLLPYYLATLQRLTEGNLAMKSREQIIDEFKNNWNSGSNDLIGQQLLEVLLDIRDQGQPVELMAERQALSKDRVVIEIGYNSFLLADTLTPDDVTTLIRFFDSAQMLDYQNKVSAERPKIEIRLVPREAITSEEIAPVDPEAEISPGGESSPSQSE